MLVSKISVRKGLRENQPNNLGVSSSVQLGKVGIISCKEKHLHDTSVSVTDRTARSNKRVSFLVLFQTGPLHVGELKVNT